MASGAGCERGGVGGGGGLGGYGGQGVRVLGFGACLWMWGCGALWDTAVLQSSGGKTFSQLQQHVCLCRISFCSLPVLPSALSAPLGPSLLCCSLCLLLFETPQSTISPFPSPLLHLPSLPLFPSHAHPFPRTSKAILLIIQPVSNLRVTLTRLCSLYLQELLQVTSDLPSPLPTHQRLTF